MINSSNDNETIAFRFQKEQNQIRSTEHRTLISDQTVLCSCVINDGESHMYQCFQLCVFVVCTVREACSVLICF